MMAGNVDSLTHNPTVTWRLQNPCVHMVSDISSRKSLKSRPSGSHFNCGLINDWCWGLFLIHALNQVNPVALNRKLLSMKKNKYAGAIYIFTIPKMTLDVSSKYTEMFNEIGVSLPGEELGDLTKASGLGATGCTGRVCLAASFLRLPFRFSNISCVLCCFWNTLLTCSCGAKFNY